MHRPELTITVRRDPAEAVVTLTGEVDVSTVTGLAATVGEILHAGPPPRIVLDMAGVTFCDSQGLGTLVVLTKRARLVSSLLVITNVGEFLQWVLDITGLRGALMLD